MNILQQLKWRYAVREFSDKTVAKADICEFVEAMRLTPSSYGLQPYRLFVVEDIEVKSQLLPHAMGQTKVRDCSSLFVLASKTSLSEADIDQHFTLTEELRGLMPGTSDGFKAHVKEVILHMSPQEQAIWAAQQAFIALGNLLTVAALKEVDACPIGGFEPQGFNQVLGLDNMGLNATVICALGYRSAQDSSALAAKVRVHTDHFCLTI